MTATLMQPTVLVLDDDPFMLKLLARLLANRGYEQVLLCADGYCALKRLADAENDVDVILCDLNMPGMDGMEFVRRLVENNYSGSIVLISGEDERFLQSVAQLIKAHGIHVLGHLHKPVDADNLARLLANWPNHAAADKASGQKCYSPEELSNAITNSQLVNFYQPKVSVVDGRFVGVETLVRWQHPSDGLIAPDSFIDIAEEHGLIDALTRHVFATAMADANIWRCQGLSPSVAVNISMDNLASLDFTDFIVNETAAAGLAPADVILEVTESRLMNNPVIVLEVLTRLRLKRFNLSIDDFGTGNSMLEHLRDIPCNELKMDKSFVCGASGDATIGTILKASNQMAKQLGMRFVAEGIEDEQDWQYLQRIGGDIAQGYFIAKPMPASDLPAWIKHWKTRTAQLTRSSNVKSIGAILRQDKACARLNALLL